MSKKEEKKERRTGRGRRKIEKTKRRKDTEHETKSKRAVEVRRTHTLFDYLLSAVRVVVY
jgi:hypothetical protein